MGRMCRCHLADGSDRKASKRERKKRREGERNRMRLISNERLEYYSFLKNWKLHNICYECTLNDGTMERWNDMEQEVTEIDLCWPTGWTTEQVNLKFVPVNP